MVKEIEILDTTLRDGEQTSGVSFAVREKLSMARLLLDELHVNRIEIASARVSEGEFESVRRIAQWAGRTRVSGSCGSTGIRRQRGIVEMDRRRRLPGSQPTGERLAPSLRTSTTQNPAATLRRYQNGHRASDRNGHRGQHLSGRLVERDAFFRPTTFTRWSIR